MRNEAAGSWSGQRVAVARAYIGSRLPADCGLCGQIVDGTVPWVVGHIKSRGAHPELTMEPTNWRAEHRSCSNRTGQAGVIAKAKADALRGPDFPLMQDAAETPPLHFSLSSNMQQSPSLQAIPARLRWTQERLWEYPWLQTTMPEDAALPLAMTPPPSNATGSYGRDAIEWIEATQTDNSGRPLTLRWWQKLAIVRQLEHDADGMLIWKTIVESGPRRIGKSVRLRGLALWRMAHAEMFGEVQLVMHTGSDLLVCREIQRQAWRWASSVGWKVTKGNGKEAIETPDEDRWLVRAQDAAGYSLDVTLGIVDEGWDVKPDTVSEGLEPSMLERNEPQLHLTSTAHRRATSLMRNKIRDALAFEDDETLLMLWGAPEGSDPGDPAVWRAASPHWSEDRAQTMAKKYASALAGEIDPDADDLDPMEGYKAQYLNMWKLKTTARTRGKEPVGEVAWESLAVSRPTRTPDAVAVEDWFGDGCSVAYAWREEDGRVTVATDGYEDLKEAAQSIRSTGYGKSILMGSSLVSDPALSGLRVRKATGRTGQAVAELSRLIGENALRHDGGSHLTGQVLSARTMPGADGPRIVSKERADAIKASVWAANALRTRKSGSVRIIRPTG